MTEVWEHMKEYLLILVSSVAGYLMYKLKQKDTQRILHEQEQDENIQELKDDLHGVKTELAVIEERTKSIMFQQERQLQQTKEHLQMLKQSITQLQELTRNK